MGLKTLRRNHEEVNLPALWLCLISPSGGQHCFAHRLDLPLGEQYDPERREILCQIIMKLISITLTQLRVPSSDLEAEGGRIEDSPGTEVTRHSVWYTVFLHGCEFSWQEKKKVEEGS